MSPEEEQTRGHKAQRVLKDEMYQEAYTEIQARLVGLLAQAEIIGEQRERLNNLLIAHNKVKQYMEQVLLGGKMAAEQIERDRTLKERMLRMVS
jgi:hypothetical protein